MCLAIPGKLVEIFDENGLKMGTVEQYTIIHAGFALKIIDEEEAAESLKLWQELIESGAFQPDEELPSPDSL